MEQIREIAALGISAILFGICYKRYVKQRNAIDGVQNAPVLELNYDLKEIVKTHKNKKNPYVVIRGEVEALGSPITSVNNHSITGAIQKLSMKEHVVARGSAGFWADQKRVIQEVYNSVPFVLRVSQTNVEVLDALTADILDLETIADHFQCSNPSVFDHIWGYFAGVRQRGVQVTEDMLREGTFMTGIGELVSENNEHGLKLQPPSDGSPFYLTVLPVSSLIRKLDEQMRLYKFLTFLCGGVGLIIVGIMTRRWWRERTRRLIQQTAQREQDSSRRKRRRNVQNTQSSESQQCVVCCQNPRQIILLPCGHVCLCEDCSERITDFCPVCRAAIETKAAAYIP